MEQLTEVSVTQLSLTTTTNENVQKVKLEDVLHIFTYTNLLFLCLGLSCMHAARTLISPWG